MSFGKFMLCIAISVAMALAVIMFYVIGEISKKRTLKPIEFYPPRGYSPLDVMIKYYSHRARPRNAINPLMLYWASRGLITIEEDCKRGLKLTKRKDITPPDDASCAEDEQIEADYNIEKQLFTDLFSCGDVVYTLAAHVSIKNMHKKFMQNCKRTAKENRTVIMSWFSGLGLVCAILSLGIVTLINADVFESAIYAAMLFPIIAIGIEKSMPNNGATTVELIIKYSFVSVWGGAPLIVVLCLVTPDSAITLVVAAACSIIALSFSQLIDIRSEQDLEIYGRISAFKQFLLDAEKDQLETLIEENPNYYYDILPYCYILKITNKLKEKFDNITTDGPSWYLGDLRDTLMF